MTPLIGITCNYFDKKHHIDNPFVMALHDQSIYTEPEDYPSSIERAGGLPVVLPANEKIELVQQYVNLCDGILIIGAQCDLDPKYYGEQPYESLNEPVERNDNFDLAIARYAIEQRKPLLGICRGAHIINVALGGSLFQDLMTAGYQEHCFVLPPKNQPRHQVSLQKDSFIHQALGAETAQVNSLHHQAIQQLAPQLRQTAVSDDGVTECFEMDGDQFVVGVQWHPEMMFDNQAQQQIFKKFVQQCLK